MREECGALGTITTKVGEMFGYEHLGQKYCNEAAGAELVISSMIGIYSGYNTKFLLYSLSNIAIRAGSIAIEYLLPEN